MIDAKSGSTAGVESSAHRSREPEQRRCPRCGDQLALGCFRSDANICSWCAWSDVEKRAKARWGDIHKRAPTRLSISRPQFVKWYAKQRDCCAYCGLTMAEAKQLRLRTARGYFVSWDIDKIEA